MTGWKHFHNNKSRRSCIIAPHLTYISHDGPLISKSSKIVQCIFARHIRPVKVLSHYSMNVISEPRTSTLLHQVTQKKCLLQFTYSDLTKFFDCFFTNVSMKI